MADSSRTKRRRLTLIGSAAAALALSVSLAPGAAVAGPPDSPHGATAASQAAAQGRPVTVMTRNLYLGAELGPIIDALESGEDAQIISAATATWAAVQATKPEERMAAIAEEIARHRPAVVGLQEVSLWWTHSSYPAVAGTGQVAYDFLDLLLDALAEQGAHYVAVEDATAENFTSPPVPILTQTGLGAVEMLDRDVILTRADVEVLNADNGNFTNKLQPPLSPVTVERGWGFADVRTKHATFRFVNSHLEAFGDDAAEMLRVAQTTELLQATMTTAMPVVYVGDYNSRAPEAAAYQLLVGSVGADAWLLANPKDPGLTCCFDAAVADPNDPLTSRIDLVVVDDDAKVLNAQVIGEEHRDMTDSGLWPSDHAGVVARLMFTG